jgi:hypothetical protein
MRLILIFLLLLPLAAEKHSPDVKAKLKAAAKADQSGELAEARRLLDEARVAEPQSVDVLELLARLARQECRWVDGLMLLKQAQELAPKKRLSDDAIREMYFLNTSRLNASPDVYCGAVARMTPPMPLKRVWPAGPCRTEAVALWVEISPDGVPEKLIALPDGVMGKCADVAAQAVSQWRFQPVVANGARVRVAIRIGLNTP